MNILIEAVKFCRVNYLFFVILTNATFSILQFSCSQSPFSNQHHYDTIPFMPHVYAARTAIFEKEPVVQGRVIFLGNSITQGGNWQQLLNDSTIINRGIGGDITYGVLKRMDDVVARKPSKIFIMIGINDIGKDIPVAVIVENYRKIIDTIRANTPGTKIFVQSVLPLNPEHQRFPRHYDRMDKVLQLNPLLKKLASDTKSEYVDLFPVFIDSNQKLNPSLSDDGLHLNQQGYELWVRHLKEKEYF